MKESLIVSGGNVDKNNIAKLIEENSFTYIIAVDKGVEILDALGVIPDNIIGDFDSVNIEILKKYEDMNIAIHKLETEKDYTDTHMALKLAIELGSSEITIAGAIGSRIDHTLSNIHLLDEANSKNVQCKIVDEKNEIMVIDKNIMIEKDEKYKYISLIPLTDEVEGVTLEGFKYGLENRTLKIGESIGISNEQVSDIAQIKIEKGKLIVIKSKD